VQPPANAKKGTLTLQRALWMERVHRRGGGREKGQAKRKGGGGGPEGEGAQRESVGERVNERQWNGPFVEAVVGYWVLGLAAFTVSPPPARQNKRCTGLILTSTSAKPARNCVAPAAAALKPLGVEMPSSDTTQTRIEEEQERKAGG
jgi:hypothetical protein